MHGVAIMCALRVIILCTCISMHGECLMVLQLVMLYVCLLFFFLFVCFFAMLVVRGVSLSMDVGW